MADLPSNMTLARRLRRYADMITIDAREDNVRIIPNQWIDNDDWRRITLLLGEIGFIWLLTNISRCWIKFANGPPRITLAARKRLTPV